MSGFPERFDMSGASLQSGVQPDAGDVAPSAELAPAGSETWSEADWRETFFATRDRLRSVAHGPKGRFVPAGAGRLSSGLRSAQLAVLIQGWVSVLERSVMTDLGGPQELSTTLRHHVRLWARAAVAEDITWHDMMQSGGPTSAKGHKRQSADQNGQYAERMARFGKDIGLTRREKDVSKMTAEQYVAWEQAKQAGQS